MASPIEVDVPFLETDSEGPLLSAIFDSHRYDLTTKQLLWSFCSLPAVTLNIVGLIHWQALRLWLKGVRLVPRPNGAANGSLATEARSDYTSAVMSARSRR